MSAPPIQSQTAKPLPDYAAVPASAFGPAPNAEGYYAGRVERNLHWVTDGVYQAAFLTTRDGVVLFDAPPSIGHNLQRAIDEVARADPASSHCASSTTVNSGLSSATSDNSPRTASPTRNGFGVGPTFRPKATPSASRCGCGSLSSSSRNDEHSC